MYKNVVALSGGMDSATLLAKVVNDEGASAVDAVGFAYGSKHNPYENEAASRIASHYGVPFEVLDLEGVFSGFKSNLLKTGGDIPEGHYEAKTMEQTVVPGRNIIFASILAGVAWSRGADCIWLGIHAGDYAIYPDCRPSFFWAMNEAISLGTDGKVILRAPFLYDYKKIILKQGMHLGVPYQLTRTCYKDQPIACGRCGSCQERLEAFRYNDILDPLEYEYRGQLPKEG